MVPHNSEDGKPGMAGSHPTHTQSEPDRWAAVRDLQWDNYYDPQTRVLHASGNHGFFSNCSTALWALTDLAAEGITPSRICMSRGWDKYCDRGKHGDVDLYDVFFQARPEVEMPYHEPLPRLHHHGCYAHLDANRWSPFIARWFTPSDEILRLQRTVSAKYGLEETPTIAFYYRGTDKSTEVAVPFVGEYMSIARRLAQLYPTHRILIQTDQLQMRERFVKEFRARCFFLEEMPVTRGKKGMHFLADEDLGMDRVEFAKMGIVVTRALSQCEILVNCTGNMALWATLYRGNTHGMYQVDEKGDLIAPNGHVFVENRYRLMLRALKRSLSPLKLSRLRRFFTASRR